MARQASGRLAAWGPWHKGVLALPLILQLLPPPAHPAFQGFGSTTPGGNRGTVVRVTSLADSGPGTLREALQGKSHRRVVFKVGGTIKLQSRLLVREQSFITIDGSTAPPPGITLEGHELHIRKSHDIIVTHLRVRHSSSDGITVKDGARNIVIDHCSLTNARDENLSVTRDARDVTVSWCIIGDTRPNSFALRTKGMLISNVGQPAVTNVSLHHNLFVNQAQRSPQISTAGLFDIRNNVIRNWQAYGVRIRNGAWGNIVNNVFKTDTNPQEAILLTPDAGPVHIAGNRGPGRGNVNLLGTAPSPFSVAPVLTDAVKVVEQKVLRRAGALPRDRIDALLARPSP
jgi:pectate lyase